jgi:hypothetical protein
MLSTKHIMSISYIIFFALLLLLGVLVGLGFLPIPFFVGAAPDICKPGETYHKGRCYAPCPGGTTPIGPLCLKKATRHLAFFPCGEGFVKQGNWCTKRATTTPRASYPADSVTPPPPPPSVMFYSNVKR